ncbi:hypothetical protein WDW37_14875 [Bdellovibrionota bacterium FG-1]
MFRFVLLGSFFIGLLCPLFLSAAPVFIQDINGKEIQLHERPLPPSYNECQYCHFKRNLQFIRGKKKLTLNHTDKSLMHGRSEMSCNNCHDINHNNYLRTTLGHQASFENSSPICQRCHADRYRNWLGGNHGKRLGYWNGAKIQFQCIDCHDPHSVKFKKMQAAPGPVIPRTAIIKKHEENHEEGKAHD